MKKIISYLLLIMMSISLGACGSSKPSAKSTVEQYLSAAKKLDGKTMSKLVIPSNTEDAEIMENLTLEDDDSYSKFFEKFFKDNANKMTYSILESKENGDEATVSVESKYIDGGPLIAATMGEAITKMIGIAFEGKEPSEEEINEMFSDILKEQEAKNEPTFKTQTVNVNLKKQDEKWYITEVNDQLKDVITLGFYSAVESIGNMFED